jgi:hypothetical protein
MSTARRSTFRSVVVMAGSLCLAGCAPRTSVPPLLSSALEIASPAGEGSGEAGLAVTAGGQALLSWIEPVGEGGHRLRFASRSKGGPWSDARTIAEGSDWFVNWADFPSVAALPDGTLFAHWLAKSDPGKYAYDVRIAASRDEGKSWTNPVVPHRDGTKTEHGFVSMMPWGTEGMGVVWLDGRKTAGKASSHGDHDGQAEMSLMHTTLAADGRLGAETLLDGRVCDCCQTDAAQAADATVVVYRDRSAKEVRDMSVVRFTGGRWSEPLPVAHDNWEIDGCPVNGPAIAASGSRVAVAWFAAPAEKARVSVAFSPDSGATFAAPIVVDDGRPLGRVDVVVLPDGAAVVSWLEQRESGGARLLVRSVTPDGGRGEVVAIADSTGARSSGFPRMALMDGEVTIAWRDAAEPPKVHTAVITLPGTVR